MTPAELTKLVEGIIVLGGVFAIGFAVFKNSTVKATIQSQKDLIDTLSEQVNQLRTLHISNEKAIAELSGQVSVYKELPLKELAESMHSIADTQDKILHQLRKNQTKQIVKEQSVEHQTVKE